MKILLTADWHIKLGQKNVPKGWQEARYLDMFNKLQYLDYDVHILAGDIFDVPNPSLQEVALFIEFLETCIRPVYIITGNHEMLTKKVSALDYLDTLCSKYSVNLITTPCTYNIHGEDIDFLPYNYLKSHKHRTTESSMLVTHVRGSIEPHVVPEVNLDVFNSYDIVLAGDLHHYHQQRNILYPGSPVTTSFVRSNDIKKGCIIFDTVDNSHRFIDLELPQLRRVTATSADQMIPTEYHHTIYELEGDAITLRTTKDTELLDKKISTVEKTHATLAFESGDIAEELHEYLETCSGLSNERTKTVLATYQETIDNDTNN